jgi:hypothetical protein
VVSPFADTDEANWHHTDLAALSEAKKSLIQTQAERYGGAHC